MKKRDLRKVSREIKNDLHLQAVQAVLQKNKTIKEVCELYGIHRQNLHRWIKNFKEKGKSALKCGKAKGSPRCLTPDEESILIKNIKNYIPEDFKMVGSLWTKEHCRQLIKKIFRKNISLSAVGRLLRRKNMSCQKPLRRAYEQDVKFVENWKKNEFKKIIKDAKKRRASIYFSDETGVRSDSNSGTTWGKIGKTPIVRRTGKRLRLNVIGAMSRRGDFRFMVYEKNMNGKLFIEFLKRLMHKRIRPVILIVDSHQAHIAKTVEKYVDSLNGKLKLVFLPPYSPEINPQEYGWNALKTRKVAATRILNMNDLRKSTRSVLRTWQKNPALVKGFFRSKETLYAA